jgi:hypothetical protein
MMGTLPGRLAACCLAAALALPAGLIGLPAAASARPLVSVKARIVPVPIDASKRSGPSYPHTGNLLGAPAALEATLQITGEEYFGAPSPLTGVVVDLPAGTRLHPQGFATCPLPVLESHEVQRCPKRSYAGPPGEVLGVVSFGSSRVREKGTLQAFFAPGGRLAFFTEGREPALVEVLAFAGISSVPPPFGPRFSAEVPLVATVPEAPYASVLSIKGRIGAGFMRGKKLISYGRVPKRCPQGGFKGRVQLSFLSGETVTVEPTVPCPKH